MDKNSEKICQVEVVKQSNTYSDPGPAMSFIFGTYSTMSWLSLIGITSADGTLINGVFQFLFALGFFACSIVNMKKGNPFGCIQMIFAVCFGMVGGANQICSVVLPLLGFPYTGTIGSIYFLLSGLYLLFIMPSMLNVPKYLFIAYFAGAIGLILLGVGGLTSISALNVIAGWALLITGVGGLYNSVAGTNEGLGLFWPPQGKGFK